MKYNTGNRINSKDVDNMSQVRTRIAPSPTGDPHVGTAYIALFNKNKKLPKYLDFKANSIINKIK